MLGSVSDNTPVHSTGHIHPAPHSLWGPGSRARQSGPEGGFQRMMRAYELMVIIDGDVDDPKAQSFVKVVTDGITAAGGTVHGKPDWWGKRQFAYPINRKETGYYLVVEAVAPAGSLNELERSLRIADEVVRHKLIKLPVAEATRRGMSGVAA
jgi:small subunit ribosomal protein S6